MFLTPEQIEALTDARRKDRQIRVLMDLGIRFMRSSSGRPKALQAEVERVMPGGPKKQKIRTEIRLLEWLDRYPLACISSTACTIGQGGLVAKRNGFACQTTTRRPYFDNCRKNPSIDYPIRPQSTSPFLICSTSSLKIFPNLNLRRFWPIHTNPLVII